MSTPSSHNNNHYRAGNGASQSDYKPPTVAAFSPTPLSGTSLASKRRSSVIVHRRSPLLVATPPVVTRALAFSHPFIVPLNLLAGLLTWTTGDPWQSFLFLAGFWTIGQYGGAVILWAGPVVVVVGLILGLYSRRYSNLTSSTFRVPAAKADLDRANAAEDSGMLHNKSLDEIVETMRVFVTRCNLLIEPFLDLIDFLSTQITPPSPTTRPPLTGLIIRIMLATPIWILLTLPPFHVLTTRRVVMTTGTIFFTYHCRPCRVARVIIWRSLLVRRICTLITGLQFSSSVYESKTPKIPISLAGTRDRPSPGIRFTFVLYENQRRWLGVGWTYSLYPSERAVWTDEMLNPAPSKDEFELPEVHGESAKWLWVDGDDWHVEGATDNSSDGQSSDDVGWVYYDSKVSKSLHYITSLLLKLTPL